LPGLGHLWGTKGRQSTTTFCSQHSTFSTTGIPSDAAGGFTKPMMQAECSTPQ
jgi:hypothetical protein